MKMKHCFKFILYRWKQSLSTGEISVKGFAFLLLQNPFFELKLPGDKACTSILVFAKPSKIYLKIYTNRP